MKFKYKLLFGLTLTLAFFSCRSTYDYRGNTDGRWVPNLETSENEKSTKSSTETVKQQNEIQTQLFSVNESNWHSDTSSQVAQKPFTVLEAKLTTLTVKTAELIPNKINRIESKKSQTKIPGFLTHKCRSPEMTFGYRMMIFGLLFLVLGGLLWLISAIHDSLWEPFWIFSILVSAIAILIIALGFLIWLFGLIIFPFLK